MRKAREENEALKLALKIKQAIGILLLLAPLIAFGQGVTITIPDGMQVAIVRVSTNAVTNAVAIAPPAPMRIGAKMAKAAELQPPSPVPPPILGKQFPYISTCSALTTQSVTTVYEVKFLRAIERTAGGALETNFATLQTNTVSVTQTNTPLRPE